MQQIIIYGAGRTGKAVLKVCRRCGDDSFHDTVVVAVPERFKLR